MEATTGEQSLIPSELSSSATLEPTASSPTPYTYSINPQPPPSLTEPLPLLSSLHMGSRSEYCECPECNQSMRTIVKRTGRNCCGDCVDFHDMKMNVGGINGCLVLICCLTCVLLLLVCLLVGAFIRLCSYICCPKYQHFCSTCGIRIY